MRYLTFILLGLFLYSPGRGQERSKGEDAAPVDSSYLHYQVQFADMMGSRGVSPEVEINNLLLQYKTNSIQSNEEFAQVLKGLYPSDAGIGVLLYFLHADTLKRVFLEPGKVREVTTMAVTRAQLLQLQQDIYGALNVYKHSESRAPKTRGAVPFTQPSKKVSFDQVIAQASALLMPQDLDTSFRHLVIIPSFNLGAMPFHLLRPYRDSAFLIERCSFSIAPSIVDLIGLRHRVRKVRLEQILFENPTGYYDNDTYLLGSTSYKINNPLFISNPLYPQTDSIAFPDLPGARAEVQAATQRFDHYKVLDGAAAVKDSVLEYMGDSDLAYFATHGIADATDPLKKSYLVLSGQSPYLTTAEIQQLRNKEGFTFPKLVVLSACQTGLGRYTDAGVVGLTRSFLIGGSMHVVMSLWNVDDQATAYLMNRFVYYLQDSEGHRFQPAEPLRLAILDTKEKYPNPVYWASFAVFGTTQ